MRVELLFADGDPAAMPARQNLVEVLTEDAFETPIQMIAVDPKRTRHCSACAARRRFGSTARTSIRHGTAHSGLAPRTYDPGDAGVPGKDLIRRAVERARGWGHGRRGT